MKRFDMMLVGIAVVGLLGIVVYKKYRDDSPSGTDVALEPQQDGRSAGDEATKTSDTSNTVQQNPGAPMATTAVQPVPSQPGSGSGSDIGQGQTGAPAEGVPVVDTPGGQQGQGNTQVQEGSGTKTGPDMVPAPEVNVTAPQQKDQGGGLYSAPNALKSALQESAKKDTAGPGAAPSKPGQAVSSGGAGTALTSPSAATDAGAGKESAGTSTASKPSATPVAKPTVDDTPKASLPGVTCDEQWKQHTNLFKQGSDVVYMTTMASQRPLASDIATSHIETITQSNGASVVREVAFSSDHPTGILLLTSLSPAPTITTSRELFVKVCEAAGGRAAGSVLFKLSNAKLVDIADDTVKVGVGTFPVYRMKFDAGLLVNSKVVNANVQVWVAKNKTGLVVKQITRIPPKVFTDHGAITITSQLAGTRKI